MAGWERWVRGGEGGSVSPPAISTSRRRRRRESLKGRGEEKHEREGGRADAGCLLGFEGEGRKRGDPGGSLRKEGGCLQCERAAAR